MNPPIPNSLVLDACCVINLFSTGQVATILRSLQCPIMVAEYVVEQEALFIFAGPPENIRASKQRIELRPLVEDGTLGVAALANEDEQQLFVALAATLDDGEAMTAAIGIRRGWSVATDEMKAINLLRSDFGLHVITTPDLIKHWADSGQVRGELMREVIERIELRARFKAGPKHPLHDWWERSAGR